MYEDERNSTGGLGGPRHHEVRSFLRFGGPLVLLIGVIFAAVGMISFFSAFGGGGPPQYFWCAFIGLPLIALGSFLSKMGFLGAVGRYVAGEAAPVAKDTFNYMADGTSDGVRTVAKAIGEGIASAGGGSAAAQSIVRCHKCNEDNDADAKFCKSCGAPLAKSKACSSCGELNDPDARFCDNCGTEYT